MFNKRVQLDLTNDLFQRWLRAQRPPLEMFAALSELEQEQLALMGDEYVQDVAIAVGIAIAHPQEASEGVSALRGDVDSEASMALRVAQNMAISPPPTPNGFSGMGGSAQRSVPSSDIKKSTAPASFMGRAPDPVEPS